MSTKWFSLIVLGSSLISACDTSQVGTGDGSELRIGVETAYPPFSWQRPDGTLAGFDIDIAEAICDQLGRECDLVQTTFDGLIPGLRAADYDAIVASLTINEERKRSVAFSRPYYRSTARFVARNGAEFTITPAGLAGKAIGVQVATSHQCFLEKHYPQAEVRAYDTQEAVFLDFEIGRLDLLISDVIQTRERFLRTEAGSASAFVGPDQYDVDCYGDGAGIAVRIGEDQLLQQINDAILALRETGRYGEINGRYFDFDLWGSDE